MESSIQTPAATLDESAAVKALAALAQAQRLRAFRAGSEARGRNLIYRANFGQMNALLGYLTEHCCEGGACEVDSQSGCAAC
jgi:ArsR family transcriptional regulator